MKYSGELSRQILPDGAESEEVERALERLYAELEQLLPVLRESSKGLRVRYEVEDVGVLAHLSQEDYSVKTESVQIPSFTLSFRCVGRNDLTYKADSIDEKERVRNNLAQFGLDFSISDLSTWRYVLAVQPVVPVRLVFEPAPDRAAIRVTVHNLRRLGVERYSIEPDAIGPELIDELRKLVLREDNRFAEFTGNRVPQAVRELLQERLRRRAVSRAKEYSHNESSESAPAAPGRLRRLLGRKEPSAAAAKPRGALHPAKEPGSESLGEIEWESPEPPESAASEGSVGEDAAGLEAVQAADDGATTAASGGEPPTVRNPEPLYAWLITDGLAAGETATKLGRLGPIGASRRFSVSKVLTAGAEFRLIDRKGAVRFGGRITGHYEGVEPVVDFGIDHDCFIIEYLRGEEWVRVRASA